ncbi:MAG: terpene cyclase/mutase family protein [Planctomycetales bacterium]|nr:terpene cyclase/mutase family protein [Planctomycetales bacterium]
MSARLATIAALTAPLWGFAGSASPAGQDAPPPVAPPSQEATPTGPTDGPAGRPHSALDGQELDDRHRARIRKGLQWLADAQATDGSYGREHYPIACTALAGLAFLSAGDVPDRGPRGPVLKRCLEYLLQQAAIPKMGYLGDVGGRMYSHGFAALFFAEVVGMVEAARREEVSRSLHMAVHLIERTQDSNGGWYYEPNRNSGSHGADISVTICQVMALRAAQGAGVAVSRDVVDRAVRCVKAACKPDGHFVYRVVDGQASTDPRNPFPRSAAGTCMLYMLGEYDAPELKLGLGYLRKSIAAAGGPTANGGLQALSPQFYHYAVYYAALAIFQAGGSDWATYFPRIRDDLMSRQLEDGRWDEGFTHGHLGTAMALIALQIPYRYLPILQR